MEITDSTQVETYTVGGHTLAVIDTYWETGARTFEVYGVGEDGKPLVRLTDGELTGMPDVVDLAGVVAGCVVLTLEVDNTYELYEAEHRTFTDVLVPRPPIDTAPGSDADEALLAEWGFGHIIDTPLTGVGHTDGDAWYDVAVTAASVPWLVGQKFDWGY